MGVESAADRIEIVVRRDERIRGRGLRDAGTRRCSERERAASGFDEERVGVSVIAALELQDLVARGGEMRRARDSHGAHRRLGARADEADALDRRHQRADTLAQRDFERARRAETGAAPRRRRERFHEPLRRVTVDERTPRHDVVDEPVAVDVLDVRARRAPDEQR